MASTIEDFEVTQLAFCQAFIICLMENLLLTLIHVYSSCSPRDGAVTITTLRSGLANQGVAGFSFSSYCLLSLNQGC